MARQQFFCQALNQDQHYIPTVMLSGFHMEHPIQCLHACFALSQICDELVPLGPHDDQTHHLMLMCLKELRRPADITRLYEAAAAKEPNNVEVLVGLFNAHTR